MSDPIVHSPSGLYRPRPLLSGHRGIVGPTGDIWDEDADNSLSGMAVASTGELADPLLDNLKYLWTCNEDGTLTDTGYAGKHLTARNSPTRFWHSATLQYGQQYNTGAICHYNSSAPAWGASNESFALGLWIRSDAAPTSLDHYFFNVESNVGDIITVRHRISTNRFIIYLSPDAGTTQYIVSANTLGAPSIGTWYYVLMQYVTDTLLTMYVNNVSQGSTGAATGYINGRVVFGARKFDGTQSRPVSVDAVHFWQNYVLSSADRTYMWNSGNGRELSP